MNTWNTYRLRGALASLAICAAALWSTGCGEQAGNNGTSTGKKDAARVQPGAAAVENGALTLPVLDALFYEEGFEAELKQKLQLTDEQIAKLKTAAREATAELSEDGVGEYTGSAKTAAANSRAKIGSIIGEEKAGELLRMVSERYASGDIDGLMPTVPNSVPRDTRIVVNAPGYRMDVFQEGKLVKTYRVGIGYPEFPLPTGMRRAETIIFNPTWTPPDEPWVRGKVKAGEKVAAGSKLNPLGPIKIPIGLPSLIHGGKAAAKLGTFASHGCVGLTNEQVQDFASVLSGLSGNGISPDSVLGYQKRKTETKTVKLDKAIPVELRYETIVAENGALRIYRDVYEHGTNTPENARRVLDVYGVKYESLNPQEKTMLEQALAEMSVDPQSEPVAANAPDDSADDASADKKTRAKKGKVTRTIVGRKEIAVPIAALQGKGYPAPANYNTGTAQHSTTTAQR